MARTDGSIIIDTRVDTTGIRKGTKEVQGMFDGLISSAKKVGAAIAAAFAIKQIVSFAKECIELGSDLEEVQNVVDVTFGKMSGKIEEFAKTAATQFGLSELSAKQYTSTMGAMLKSMGFAGDEVADMSIKMAGLAADMASFYNLETDEAFAKIRSGISGETEPLKQLGVNLSEANLEQFRLNQGMETAYSKMSQQEKALLRYNYLLSVTSDAQGDFARTSDSWANQLKILKLQFDSIKADLGQGFINIFKPVLKMINAVLQGIAKLASSFKAFTNLITGKSGDTGTNADSVDMSAVSDSYTDAADSADEYANATDKAAKATKKANKENQKYTSGLDKIHQYQSNTTAATSSSTPASSGTGSTSTAPVDFGSLEKGDTVIDKTAQKMKDLYDRIIQGAEPAINALKKLYNEGLKKVGSFAWKAAKDFYDHFLVPVGKWVMGEGLPRLINALNDGLNKVKWDKINDGLVKVWGALAPFAQHVGEGFLWFWEKVLVPLGTWTANEVVPRFLETVANVIEIADAILVAAQPGFKWFWDHVLQPIAEWTGGIFTQVWDWINDRLADFAQWCKDNPAVIENITTFVTAFFAALAGITVITQIGTLISTLGTLIGTIMGIIGAINPVTAAIAAAIAIGVLLWKNWDTIKEKAVEIWGAIQKWFATTWAKIKETFTKTMDLIKTKVKNGWDAMKKTIESVWKGIKTWFSTTWEGIKTTFNNAVENIKTKLSNAWTAMKDTASTVWGAIKNTLKSTWDGISTTAIGIFNGIKDKATGIWNNVKENASKSWEAVKTAVTKVFSTIGEKADKMRDKIKNAFVNAFNGIVKLIKTPINGIIGAINGVIRGIVSGINAMIDALNKLHFDVPSWVPGIGGKKFGLNIPRITSYPQIPQLAQGAVIPPNAPFLATLGDQKSGTNLELPEKLLRQVVREESGGNKKYEFKAILNRRVIFDEIIAEARLRQQMTAANPFDLA